MDYSPFFRLCHKRARKHGLHQACDACLTRGCPLRIVLADDVGADAKDVRDILLSPAFDKNLGSQCVPESMSVRAGNC